MSPKVRKATELPLDDALITEATALGLDVANAAEDGIARAVKAEKERRWKIENAEAIQAEKDYVAKHGLPFAKYRQF
ncbi:type II toxin-antitoxin system CcdA family antitoxin [Agrobacterium sp. a22-2]|uniref:type II toxin-antitoxin system CcdA family antitoxin n=1 Tax=Agrobacterium sp. a22-2 TaxID=2283840 RepID=UPI001447DA86|nr:type II toxin-antitoxin system CcdA family antitoxin [Agrobacterium sp. a22-2]NKN37475.1 type II toxin-antitoxin system CcdA family antitoxin [Agrobacterium sp. a22-2]